MNLRRGGIWYLAGLLLALIAGVVAVLALRQAVPTAPAETTRPVTRPVIVAAQDIGSRQIVPFDALEARDYLIEDIPSGAIFRVEDAAGKFTLAPITAGQPMLAQSLASPPSGSTGTITSTIQLSALLPEDKIAVSIPADDLLTQSGDIGIGDHIDLLASIVVVGAEEGEAGQVTMMNIQNAPVVKVLEDAKQAANAEEAATQPREIVGLVIAVDPQDAVILKYFLDSNARISIGLRSTELTSTADVLPVTVNFLANRYGINVPRPVE